jgi:hypothetical protein
MEIWEPKTPGTLWATPALLRDSFNFYFFTLTSIAASKTLNIRDFLEICYGPNSYVQYPCLMNLQLRSKQKNAFR